MRDDHPGTPGSAPSINSTVTFVFTDIVGSTSQTASVGDHAWIAALRTHNERIRAHVATHRGREVKTTGDGFMLAFASARDAIACALDIRDSLLDQPIDVRVGIHTGEAVEEGADYVGHHVNVAQRIMSAAAGSEILASATARELAVGMHGIEFGDARSVEGRGLAEPCTVFTVERDVGRSLRVEVLGRLRIMWQGREAVVSAPKERALFVLLALAAGRTVATDRLLEELWPELDPARGRAALQVRVSALRKMLGSRSRQPIESDRSGYRLAMHADDLDATRFEHAVHDARTAATAGDHDTAATMLASALSRWQGSALADAALSPALEAEAARLEELRLTAIEDRLESDLACRRHREVVEGAEALVGAHPLRERAWASLMLALYRCGRQADALAAYRRVREHLVAELGIEPGPRLRELEAAVLAHDPALDAPEHSAAHVAPGSAAAPTRRPELPAAIHRARTSDLVGRDDELECLQRAWQEAVAGNGGVAVIAGEAGIGKTRLAAELARAAHDQGALVVLGRCDAEAVAPYQPVRQALAMALRARPDAFLSANRYELAPLARLLPELREHVAPADLAPTIDEDRYSLFEATATVLRTVAATQPILLVLDDVQSIDPSSLQLVRHLTTHPTASAVLHVCTCRIEDGASTALAAQLCADADRAGRPSARVDLAGLSEAALAAAAVLMLDGEQPTLEPSFGLALHRATQGNPFFARETVRHLLETGGLSTSRVLAVPESVLAVVARRLGALPLPTRRCLEAAAVIGNEFPLDLLAAVTGAADVDTLDALEPAIEARVVVEAGGDADTYAFTHPVIRQALDAGMLRGRSRRMHLAIADAIEHRFPSEEGEHLASVAFHLEAAGRLVDERRLHPVAVAAARHAMSVLAYEDAARLFQIALRTADAAAVPPVDQVELRIGLGEALVVSGDPEGRKVLAEAGDLARQHGAPEQLARAVFAASQESIAIAYHDAGFIEMLQDALAALGPDDSALRARVLGRLGFELFLGDPTDRGSRLSDEAVAIARRVGDAATLATVLGHRRMYHDPGEDVAAAGRELVEVAEAAGDPTAVLVGHVSLASGLLQQGDLDATGRQVSYLAGEAERLRRPRMQWWAVHASGVLASVRGELDRSDELLGEALTSGQRTGEPNAVGWFLCQSYVNARLRGILGSIAPLLDEYVDAFPFSILARAAQPFVHVRAGDVDRARAELDRFAADDFGGVRPDTNWFATMATLSEAAVALDARGDAKVLRAHLEPFVDAVIDIGCVSACYGPVARVVGILSAITGDLDGAVEHLRAAVDVCERMPSPPWLALSQHELSRVLAQRCGAGDTASAARLREAAEANAKQSGVALE